MFKARREAGFFVLCALRRLWSAAAHGCVIRRPNHIVERSRPGYRTSAAGANESSPARSEASAGNAQKRPSPAGTTKKTSAAALGSGICRHYLAARDSLFSIAIWDTAIAEEVVVLCWVRFPRFLSSFRARVLPASPLRRPCEPLQATACFRWSYQRQLSIP
jgi:hypothetical protein